MAHHHNAFAQSTSLAYKGAVTFASIAGRWQVWLAVIVALGAALRFWNLNWDEGAYYFHPDEWALNETVRTLGPDLNPRFFFYGSFPIYLYRFTAEVLGWLTGLDWLARERLPLIGRAFSALASTAMLPLVFAVGRRIWGMWAGLLAASLTAGAALLIQAAHFGTVDTAITLAGVTLLWASLRILAGAGRGWYIFSGVILGLAVATKLTAASFLLLPLLSHLLMRKRNEAALTSSLVRRHSSLLILLACAAIVTFLTAPYYLLAWDDFWRAIVEQTGELSGGYKLPYTWQFIGSTLYLFELRNLVTWGLGLPLGIAALIGWAWMLAQAALKRPAPLVILTAWPTFYFAYIGTWEARFVRHTLPLVPFCCLFAAGGLVALCRLFDRRGRAVSWLARLAVAAVLVGALGWGLAVSGIYSQRDTRLAATDWIYKNVPAGSRLVVEDKNDLVPVPGFSPEGTQHDAHTFGVLKVTAPDTPAKMADFAATLAEGDMLVIPNRRWSGVLPRLSSFPLTGRYYSLLLSGKLGYSQVATFSNPPRLGPFTWPDDDVEETFQVFDHPTVRIFRNTGRLSNEALGALLAAPP